MNHVLVHWPEMRAKDFAPWRARFHPMRIAAPSSWAPAATQRRCLKNARKVSKDCNAHSCHGSVASCPRAVLSELSPLRYTPRPKRLRCQSSSLASTQCLFCRLPKSLAKRQTPLETKERVRSKWATPFKTTGLGLPGGSSQESVQPKTYWCPFGLPSHANQRGVCFEQQGSVDQSPRTSAGPVDELVAQRHGRAGLRQLLHVLSIRPTSVKRGVELCPQNGLVAQQWVSE